jgi:hypothetical protein
MIAEGYKRAEIRAMYKPEDQDSKRFVVITKFNCKQYQVDDLSFDITPKNKFIEWRFKGKVYQTNLVEYFKIKHK